MTTASGKCTQTRPLFWKIRIKSWSRNSFPSPFFTRRSQPGSALHVEGRLEASRGRECPAQGPREAVGVHITAKASQESAVTAGHLPVSPAVLHGLAMELGGDVCTYV